MAKYEDLKEKRVVVTGGASGIGLATAKRFAREGSKVVILDYNGDGINMVLKDNPEIAGGVKADVSNPKDVENAFSKVDELIGGIDVLISNAGISVRKPFIEIDYEQ